MIIVSAGIRPRDDLAQACRARRRRARRHRRQRSAADVRSATSSPSAKCALHGGMIYGLVAPGYEMAEIVAANLTGGDRTFRRHRSLDQAQADGRRRRQLRRLRSCRPSRRRRSCSKIRSPASTRSCSSSPDGTRLLGGILVGDAARLRQAARCSPRATRRCPASRTSCSSARPAATARRSASTRCPTRRRSARATTSARAQICAAIREQGLDTVAARQALHQGRHRLRRLRAAGDRPASRPS